MTPQQFREGRTKLGLSARQLGLILGLGDPGRHIRHYESGGTPISGPVKLAMRYLLRYGLDKEAKALAGPKRAPVAACEGVPLP